MFPDDSAYFDLLVPEGLPPELSGVSLGDAAVVALKQAVGEDGLQLRQHVAEDQRQLGQIPPVDRKWVAGRWRVRITR